jgi:hypothetical protein
MIKSAVNLDNVLVGIITSVGQKGIYITILTLLTTKSTLRLCTYDFLLFSNVCPLACRPVCGGRHYTSSYVTSFADDAGDDDAGDDDDDDDDDSDDDNNNDDDDDDVDDNAADDDDGDVDDDDDDERGLSRRLSFFLLTCKCMVVIGVDGVLGKAPNVVAVVSVETVMLLLLFVFLL